MKIKVETCWGGNVFYYRLTPQPMPQGKKRLVVVGSDWTRQVASAALDEVTRYYGAKRRNVRFDHV